MTTTRPVNKASRQAPPGVGADLTSFYEVHGALRRSAEALVTSLADEPARIRSSAAPLSRWFAGLTRELAHHHTVEDKILFPALADRVPTYEQYRAQVDSDHDRLDALIDATRVALHTFVQSLSDQACAQALSTATEMRDHLITHLEFEDNDVVPMFKRHFSTEEYAILDRRVMKSINKRQALFSVPSFMTTADTEAAARTLAGAPIVRRIVYRVTRKRFTRMFMPRSEPTAVIAHPECRHDSDQLA